MKKIILVIAIMFFALPVFAADLSMVLDFSWSQTSTDLPNLKEWGLYVTPTSGGVKPAPIVVSYTSGTGPFTTSSTFTVTGTPGSTVRRYFVLDAVSKNGNRSVVSNEVYWDFVIPYSDVTTPITLKITVIVK